MGWQEQQAASRARDQQRQMEQDRQSRQRADQIRADNDASNRRAAQASRDAGFAATRARADSDRRAAAAASAKSHKEFMRAQGNTSSGFWGAKKQAIPEPRYTPVPVSGGGGKTQSKGGGLLFALIVIGGIVAVANKSPSTSTNSTPPRAVQSVSRPTARTLTGPALSQRVSEAPPLRKVGHLLVDHNGFILAESDPNAPAPTVTASPRTVVNKPLIVEVGVQPNGSISSVTPETGDPVLMPAAIAAAKQFTFKSYPYEAGKPVHTYRVSFPITSVAAGSTP